MLTDAERPHASYALASLTSIAGGASNLFHVLNDALAFLSTIFGIVIGAITIFGMIRAAAKRRGPAA